MTEQRPTPEQIERYIEWADAEAGPFCTDEWVEAVRQQLRQWVASAERHRATPEQWAAQEQWASPPDSDPYALCLLELRARVEALEAAQRPAQPIRCQPLRVETVYGDPSVPVDGMVREVSMGDEPWLVQVDGIQHGPAKPPAPSPADSLVERVAEFFSIDNESWTDETPYFTMARDVIREVAAWLEETDTRGGLPDDAGEVPGLLEREANQ